MEFDFYATIAIGPDTFARRADYARGLRTIGARPGCFARRAVGYRRGYHRKISVMLATTAVRTGVLILFKVVISFSHQPVTVILCEGSINQLEYMAWRNAGRCTGAKVC